jgi:autotransporter-associated beta strand protein
MHPPRILNLFHGALRTCLAVLASLVLMPGVAHATVFSPPVGSLPANISAPGVALVGFLQGGGQSTITVSGILTSISAVKCGVWLTYPSIGMLAITLQSPDGTQVILADMEGMIDTGNNNGLGGIGGGIGGGEGGIGGGGVGGVGTTGANGSYGIGAGIAPGGEVQFDDTAANSIDEFRGSALDVIPSAVYRCTTTPGYLNANANNKLALFQGKADLNVNGTWTLSVLNFDIAFGGFNGATTTSQETGQINSWTLEIDEVGVHVWTGAAFGGFGNAWSQNGNWSNGAPQAFEQKVVLDFPAVAAQYIANNDTPLNALTLGQVTIDGNYTITGNGVRTTGNALFMNQGGTSTWSIPLALGWPVDGLLGPNGSTLQATGITIDVFAGQLTMSGAISGGAVAVAGSTRGPTTIDTEGPGTLIFSGANTYLGQTNVDSGILDAQSGTALSGSATFVSAGATLQLGIPGAATPFATMTEPLSIDSVGVGAVGALEMVSTGLVTYTGQITLASDDAAVGAVAGGALTLNNLVGGGLTFEGQGLTSVLNVNSALPGANLADNGGTVNLPIANSVPNVAVANGGQINAPVNLTVLSAFYSGPSATSNTFTGNLIVGAGPRTITVDPGTANPGLIMTGTLTGQGSLNQYGIGNLELDCAAGAQPIAYTVYQGTLSGTAGLGTLVAMPGTVVMPGINATGAGNMTTTGGVSLSAGSLYVAQIFGGAQLHVGGPLFLSGATATGAGGAYLSPVGGAAGTYTVITYPAPVGLVPGLTPSAFVNRPYPASNGITYGVAGSTGTANCIQLTLDGSTVALVNNTYTLSKGAGNVPVAVTWGGTVSPNASSDLVAVPGTAIQAQDFNQPSPTPLLESAGSTFTLPIVQNYIAEGNTTFSLLLVPMGQTTAARGNSDASVTIIDNQDSGYEKKRCGIGSGFTVFFLFAIGLALRALYLRRR